MSPSLVEAAAVLAGDGLVAEYLAAMRRRGLAPVTLKSKGESLRHFARYLGRPLVTATADDVQGWLDARPKPLLSNSRYWHLSHLSVFYRWCVRHGLADVDPTAVIDRPKYQKGMPRPLARKDRDQALELADPRIRCWVALTNFAGLRCTEIAHLRREDVWTERELIHVVFGKGGRQRTVPLNAYVEACLSAYGMPRRGWLFPGRADGHVSPRTVSRRVNALYRALDSDGTAHRGRHTFATEVLDETGDLMAVRDLLGHADLSTTQVYAAWKPPPSVARVVRGLGPGGDGPDPPTLF